MEKSDLVCDSNCGNESVVEEVKASFMADEILFDLADFYNKQTIIVVTKKDDFLDRKSSFFI